MKYVYEFIGTFFLVLTVGLTILEPKSIGLWAPFAIGSILGVMIYAGMHVSGGHYNPAVSLALFLRKRLNLNDLWIYWIAQLAGAVIAAYVAIYLKGGIASTPLNPDYLKALISEFLFTFALCFVVLNITTTKANANSSFFGWAIGLTVIVGAYAVGAISSGAFNPAVAVASSIMNLTLWSNIWIYIVSNFLGGIAAVLVVNAADDT